MGKYRVEAFSDGVIAIIITIMVLQMKVPIGENILALRSLIPSLMSYILSFIYIGIYWNNHHHMLHAVRYVNGPSLWANLHLLFWMSLIPFVTDWMGENHFADWPVALYGMVLLMAALAYYILSHALIKLHGQNSALAIALGKDIKGKLSIMLYMVAVAFAFIDHWIALSLYVVVAIIWFIPDPRIEKTLKYHDNSS